MFLPEKFRLPTNITDTAALQVNLNLHASIVCLHSAACDAVKKYGLDKRLGERSKVRRLNAAREVVKIMRLTRQTTSPYVRRVYFLPLLLRRPVIHLLTTSSQKTPLVALSLYCASTVYVDLAREDFSSTSPASLPPWVTSELEYLVECMESIGRQHVVTRAYLNQLLLDIAQSGVDAYFNLPNIKRYGCCNHGIPLLVRTAVSRHTKNQGRPLMPRMMPMGGRIISEGANWSTSSSGCGGGGTTTQACGGSLNEDGRMPAVGPPLESGLGACSGGIRCPGKQGQNGDTAGTSGDGSGPGMAPETKRRRVHHEKEPSFIERIDLSDLFKLGSSGLPFQQHQQQYQQPPPTVALSSNIITGNTADEFNDGWGPGPATAIGPPHLMDSNSSSETSRPVVQVQLPHRTINNNSYTTAIFADNNSAADNNGSLSLSSDFVDPIDIQPLEVESITNMDVFYDLTGMDRSGLDLTNTVVDPSLWDARNDNSDSNSNIDTNGKKSNDRNESNYSGPGLDGICDDDGITTAGGSGGDNNDGYDDAWMQLIGAGN